MKSFIDSHNEYHNENNTGDIQEGFLIMSLKLAYRRPSGKYECLVFPIKDGKVTEWRPIATHWCSTRDEVVRIHRSEVVKLQEQLREKEKDEKID